MVTYEDALKIVMNSFSKNHIIYGFADYSDENKYVFSVKQKNCDGLMDSTVDMVVDKETGETETTRNYFDIIRLLFPEREKEIVKTYKQLSIECGASHPIMNSGDYIESIEDDAHISVQVADQTSFARTDLDIVISELDDQIGIRATVT